MTELALYRKWRSKNFEELVGQPHITQTLHNAVASGKIAHAYLFCGPRGTGKTSAAKIFAKALNCESGPTPTPCGTCANCAGIQNGTILDCIEIDAASNRGIDEIRDLREKIKFPPTVCRYKVYIVDEVHMLTPEAFNALLKTLEEPPPQTVFVLCTTEPHKLLPTVASRCQRFDFRRISAAIVEKRLEEVAAAEHLRIGEGVLPLIARASDGSLRDALSLLDQLRTFCQDVIDKEKTELLLGRTPRETVSAVMGILAGRNLRKLLMTLHGFMDNGGDLTQLVRDLVDEFRRLLLWKIAPESVETTEEEKSALKEAAPRLQADELYRILRHLSDLRNELRLSPHPMLSAEIAFMRILHAEWEPSLEGLKRRIDMLEEKAARAPGGPPPSAAPRPATPDRSPTATAASCPPSPDPTGQRAPGRESSAPLSLDEVQSRWPEVVERLGARHPLIPYLQEARPVKLEGNTLTLAFPNVILKNKFEQKKEEARQILKENFQVSFQLAGEVETVDHETFVQEAKELFFEETVSLGDANA